MFDMQGKYKWDAWKKNEGKSKEQAQKEYVDYFFTVSFAASRGL
jgi:diazepam-binding inhibitor (GABA receptor modulating acyl-CoA-binding protein)